MNDLFSRREQDRIAAGVLLLVPALYVIDRIDPPLADNTVLMLYGAFVGVSVLAAHVELARRLLRSWQARRSPRP